MKMRYSINVLIALTLFSLSSFCQEQLPMRLPPTPNITDSLGRKQGFWLDEISQYGETFIELYQDGRATTKYAYYEDKSLYWVSALKNNKWDGEFRFYSRDSLAQLGWYDQGLPNRRKSVEIVQKKLTEVTGQYGRFSKQSALWVLNLATVFTEWRHLKEAEKCYVEAVDIAKSLKDKYFTEMNLSALKGFYIDNGMYKKASIVLPEVLTLELAASLKGRYFGSLKDLGTCYNKLQQKDSAVKVLKKALEYARSFVPKDSSAKPHHYVTVYKTQFDLAYVAKDSTQIENMLKDAKEHLDAGDYNNYALDPAYRFYRDFDNYKRAEELINLAEQLIAKHPTQTAWGYIGWMPDRADLYFWQKKYQESEAT